MRIVPSEARQNDVVERMKRKLNECTKSMRFILDCQRHSGSML